MSWQTERQQLNKPNANSSPALRLFQLKNFLQSITTV
jgi:hypothetical protein